MSQKNDKMILKYSLVFLQVGICEITYHFIPR